MDKKEIEKIDSSNILIELDKIESFDKSKWEFIKNISSDLVGSNLKYYNMLEGNLYTSKISPDRLLKYKDGSTSSIIYDGKQIVGASGFINVGLLDYIPLGVFEISSFISQEYYLKMISNHLKNIDENIDSIIKRQNSNDFFNINYFNEILIEYNERNDFDLHDLSKLENMIENVKKIMFYYKNDISPKIENYSLILEEENNKNNSTFELVSLLKAIPLLTIAISYNKIQRLKNKFIKVKQKKIITEIKKMWDELRILVYCDHFLKLAEVIKIKLFANLKEINREKKISAIENLSSILKDNKVFTQFRIFNEVYNKIYKKELKSFVEQSNEKGKEVLNPLLESFDNYSKELIILVDSAEKSYNDFSKVLTQEQEVLFDFKHNEVNIYKKNS